MEIRKSPHNSAKRAALVVLLICLVAAGGFVWWYIYRPNSPILPAHTDEQKQASDSQHTTLGSSTQSASSSISSSKDISISKATPVLDSHITPAAPEGTFVSNHRPNLSGAPAPSSEVSVCHTTPGALCVITFTNGDSTFSLTSQAVDGNGNTSWAWDIKTIGLTEGSWTITATATNGTKTASTTDTMKLEIAQ